MSHAVDMYYITVTSVVHTYTTICACLLWYIGTTSSENVSLLESVLCGTIVCTIVCLRYVHDENDLILSEHYGAVCIF